ncbi:MAG: tetratricopeptide repeat protein [bacterium]
MRRKYFIFLFAFFLLAGCVNVEKEADNHFRRAEDLKSQGDFSGAVQEYRIIVYKYSKSSLAPRAWQSIADCEKEIDIAKTVMVADTLINEKYNDAGLFVLRDLINKYPGGYLSGEISKKIDSLTGGQAENLLNMAMEFQKKGKYTEAIESYEKFMNAFPNSKEKDNIQLYISQCREEIARQKSLEEKQKRQTELDQKKAEEERKKKETELAEKEKQQKEIKKKQSIEDALKSLKEKTK